MSIYQFVLYNRSRSVCFINNVFKVTGIITVSVTKETDYKRKLIDYSMLQQCDEHTNEALEVGEKNSVELGALFQNQRALHHRR